MENYETTQKDFQGKHVKGLPPDEYKLAPGESIKAEGKVWSESSKLTEKDKKGKKENIFKSVLTTVSASKVGGTSSPKASPR